MNGASAKSDRASSTPQSRAAALADETAGPQHAVLIALAADLHCPRYLRELNHNTIAAGGSHLYGPWVASSPFPRAQAVHRDAHNHLTPHASRRACRLLPCSTGGRMSRPSIQRCLAALDAPSLMWHDPRRRRQRRRPRSAAHPLHLESPASRSLRRKQQRRSESAQIVEERRSAIRPRVGACRS
jgi:hypothetical protein